MQCSGRGYRVACVVMVAYFLFASAVQINDPDAILWGSFYLAAAALTLLAIWRTPPAWMPGSLGLIATVWGALLVPGAFKTSFRALFQSWQMMSGEMEVGRELLGLVIVVVWMFIVFKHARRGSGHPAS